MTYEPLPALFEAADLAAGLLADQAVAERWAEPSALDGYSVGGLAAHIHMGLRRLEASLDEALPDEPTTVGVAEFYGANRVDDPSELAAGLHPYLRQEGEQRAARYGPAGVHRRFVELVARLRDRLPDAPPARPVPVLQVPNGIAPLDAYLTTRIVELVVHSDDLATSVQLPPLTLPRSVASVVIGTLIEMARGRSGDLDVIRALSRRERAGEDVLRAL
jgi:uncharacterized protein (TIGR03083 family)